MVPTPASNASSSRPTINRPPTVRPHEPSGLCPSPRTIAATGRSFWRPRNPSRRPLGFRPRRRRAGRIHSRSLSPGRGPAGRRPLPGRAAGRGSSGSGRSRLGPPGPSPACEPHQGSGRTRRHRPGPRARRPIHLRAQRRTRGLTSRLPRPQIFRRLLINPRRANRLLPLPGIRCRTCRRSPNISVADRCRTRSSTGLRAEDRAWP